MSVSVCTQYQPFARVIYISFSPSPLLQEGGGAKKKRVECFFKRATCRPPFFFSFWLFARVVPFRSVSCEKRQHSGSPRFVSLARFHLASRSKRKDYFSLPFFLHCFNTVYFFSVATSLLAFHFGSQNFPGRPFDLLKSTLLPCSRGIFAT